MSDGALKGRWRDILRARGLGCLAALGFCIWLHAADSLVVATVMPSAVAEIGGLAVIGWPVLLYQLGSIVAGITAARLAGHFGLRGAIVGAACVYAFGCVLSGVAPTILILLLGRLLQGIGGGSLVATAFVAVFHLYDEAAWPRLLALLSGVWGVSALVGPLIGGLFATAGHWRGAFLAFALQGAAAALVAAGTLEVGQHPPVERGAAPVLRLLLLSAGIMTIAIAGIEASALTALATALLGLALLVAFLRIDGHSRARLLPRGAFDLRRPQGAGIVMSLTLSMATIPFTVYGPLLMETLYGASPVEAGLMITVEAVSWTVAALLVAGARPALEPLFIRGGAVTVLAGVLGFTILVPLGPLPALLPCAVLQGAGFGAAAAFVSRRAIAHLPPDERSTGASAMASSQLAGYALGAGISGMAANMAGFAGGLAPATAAAAAPWIFGIFLPLGLVGLSAAWRIAAPRREAPAPA